MKEPNNHPLARPGETPQETAQRVGWYTYQQHTKPERAKRQEIERIQRERAKQERDEWRKDMEERATRDVRNN